MYGRGRCRTVRLSTHGALCLANAVTRWPEFCGCSLLTLSLPSLHSQCGSCRWQSLLLSLYLGRSVRYPTVNLPYIQVQATVLAFLQSTRGAEPTVPVRQPLKKVVFNSCTVSKLSYSVSVYSQSFAQRIARRSKQFRSSVPNF